MLAAGLITFGRPTAFAETVTLNAGQDNVRTPKS